MVRLGFIVGIKREALQDGSYSKKHDAAFKAGVALGAVRGGEDGRLDFQRLQGPWEPGQTKEKEIVGRVTGYLYRWEKEDRQGK